MRNDRGTQVGANRRIPPLASISARTAAGEMAGVLIRLPSAVSVGRSNRKALISGGNGAVLRAVEVIPAKLPLKPSDLDWRIVHHVVSIIHAEDRCYRSLREHAKPKCLDVPGEMIPDTRFLDCSALDGLKLPSLKHLAKQIGKKDPALKRLSRQKIADALRKFGMRIPTSLAPA